VPWLDEAVEMKVMMFYSGSPHVFGCQFSNLFESPFEVDTKWRVPTADGSVQFLMNHERASDGERGENVVEFKSSESVFQSAKARDRADCSFVQSLTPELAASAGQSRLIMDDHLAAQYRAFGGTPFRVRENEWMFSEHDQRFPVRENWKIHKLEIMNHALRLKFLKRNWYHLMAEYVECEVPTFFVEHSPMDKQWADGKTGIGTNFLGKMLTELAWKHRIGEADDEVMMRSTEPMSPEFLSWLKLENAEIIVNGREWYQEHSHCEWLD